MYVWQLKIDEFLAWKVDLIEHETDLPNLLKLWLPALVREYAWFLVRLHYHYFIIGS